MLRIIFEIRRYLKIDIISIHTYATFPQKSHLMINNKTKQKDIFLDNQKRAK